MLINVTFYFERCDDNWEGIAFWMSVSVVSIVFGLPAGIAILWEMFQRHRRGTHFTPNDIFMLNLTVMDVMYLVFVLPDVYNFPFGHNFVYESFMFFLFSFKVCGRPLFMTCMCLDCYLAVVHPVTYRARKSLTPRVLMAVGVWTVTFAEGCFFAVVYARILSSIFPVLVIILTIPVIGFCDFSILWTLKRSDPGGRGRDLHPQKKKALQTITNNLAISFISYLPPVLIYLMPLFKYMTETTFWCLVSIPALSITTIASAVLPVLYLNNLGKLDWLKCWKRE